MRSMWNGTITFGLVNIPVGMYPATKENQVSFHLLHKKDCGRIKNQRVCTECGEVLDYDELVKGFEYEKGEYVTLTEEDLKKVKPEATETITICGFVELNDIDPVYFDNPYYLIPAKKSDKIYALLREALKKSNKVGIATFVLRTKQYLAAVRPYGNALVLNTMHYADEVRSAEEMPAADTEIPSREMDMAVQLIEAMEEEFDPEKYKDTYNEALTALIDKKLTGKDIKPKARPKEPTNVLDLMSRLKASLEKAEKEEPAPAGAARKNATSARKGPSRSATGAKGKGAAPARKASPGKEGARKAAKTASPASKTSRNAKKPRLRLVA